MGELLPHSCFLSFPPQVSTRSEFTIQKTQKQNPKNQKGFLESALTLPTNTEWAWSRRYLLKSGFVYFLPLSPSVLFEAAELLTRSLTFCAFKGILGCCRKPRDWTTSRRLRERFASTIYHHASEKANFRLNSKYKTHLFRRKMSEAACFVIRAETTQPGPPLALRGTPQPPTRDPTVIYTTQNGCKSGREQAGLFFCLPLVHLAQVSSSSYLNKEGLRLKMVHLNEPGCKQQKWSWPVPRGMPPKRPCSVGLTQRVGVLAVLGEFSWDVLDPLEKSLTPFK